MLTGQLRLTAVAFLVTFALNLFKVKYLSNALSPADFGVYSLFFNTVSVGSILLMLGMDRFLIKRAATVDTDEARSSLATVLICYFLMCGLAIPAIFVFPLERPLLAGFWLGAALFGICTVLRFYLLGRQRVSSYNMVNLCMLHAWLLGLPLVALSHTLSLSVVLLLMNLGFAASCLLALVLVVRDSGWPLPIWSGIGGRILDGLRFSLPLIPLTFASKFIQAGDRFFLMGIDGPLAVANYTLASSILGILVALMTVVSDTLRPYILKHGNSEIGERLLLSGMAVMLLLVSMIVPGVLIFGAKAIALLSNHAYVGAASLLPWLMPVLYAQAFIPFATFVLERQDATAKIGYSYGAAFILFVVLNFCLDTSLKAEGCALSYSISMVVLAIALVGLCGLHRLVLRLDWLALFKAGLAIGGATLIGTLLPLDETFRLGIFTGLIGLVFLWSTRPHLHTLSGSHSNG